MVKVNGFSLLLLFIFQASGSTGQTTGYRDFNSADSVMLSYPVFNTVTSITSKDSLVICRHRLLKNTGVVAGASLLTFGVLLLLPEETTYWNIDEMTASSMGEQWWDHVTSGPVWDEDDWFFNWVGHPYCGAIFYMGARGAGYKVLPSFLYSATMSTVFWEYGIEAFAEVPSVQDLIITPVVGSALGEGFYVVKKHIRKSDDKLFGKRWAGEVTMWLMDPLNQIVDLFDKEDCNNPLNVTGQVLPYGKGALCQISLHWELGRSLKNVQKTF